MWLETPAAARATEVQFQLVSGTETKAEAPQWGRSSSQRTSHTVRERRGGKKEDAGGRLKPAGARNL